MKFKTSLIREHILQGNPEDSPFKIIKTSSWTAEGKYETCSFIFKHEDKFFRVYESRSGSYFTEYHYESQDWDDEIDCEEVEEIEIVKKTWKVKLS